MHARVSKWDQMCGGGGYDEGEGELRRLLAADSGWRMWSAQGMANCKHKKTILNKEQAEQKRNQFE